MFFFLNNKCTLNNVKVVHYISTRLTAIICVDVLEAENDNIYEEHNLGLYL